MTEKTVHRYEPLGAPGELFRSRLPEVLLSGPAGTGKSRACLEKIHAAALKYPGMRALVLRKTQVSLSSTGLVTFEKYVIPEFLAAGLITWYSGSPKEPASYRYFNGSTIVVGGLDKATRIMSSEYDLIYVQEATEITENDWESLTTRLRNNRIPGYQQLLADCNPAQPTHWLKQRCDRGSAQMLQCRHEDNPTLFNPDGTPTEFGASYLSKLDNLTGVRYLRLRKGIWAAAEGIIYDEWDEATHLVDRFEIPKDWARLWSVDFGFTHPFVLQCWAIDPDGRMYLYREIFHTKRLVEDHARNILKVVTKDGIWIEPKPQKVVCDHDAEGRGTLTKHLGISTVAANKRVLEGIQTTQARLRPAKDGKPRLFIMRDSVIETDEELRDTSQPASTYEEIAGYTWLTGPDGRATKEAPVKEHDDGMDAMRYAVMSVERPSIPKMRWT